MTKPTIDLLAEARAEKRKPNGEPCNIVTATLDHPDLAASILAVIRDTSISPTTASRTFARHNINISHLTIGRHRRTPCAHCTYHGISL